jgi:hypothetical protein
MRANSSGFALLIILASGSGCTEPAAEGHHDPKRARLALVPALDAWKRGEARALARRAPPVRFVDEDFAAGWKLADYEIVEPDTPIRQFENVAVILSLRDKGGRTVRRETAYQVVTDPALAVLRSDP